ncbi:MAG: preprotein translocase subunit YajC [Bacteroidia bacterium]|nr:preprotein translocase subunit YajC [Bacteroidia bacterium]
MINTILLQAGMGPGTQQLLMILMIIAIFYFFMIRPQMTKAKKEKQFKDSIQKGDKVVSVGGLHGKVIEVNDTTFSVEIANNVRVKMEKSAISADNSKQYAKEVTKKD